MPPEEENATDDLFRNLTRAMISAWQACPPRPKVHIPEETRAAVSDAGAVAVIWGWTARVVRMAEAALLLHGEGFNVEVAPLVRSMLEHAIALHWVVDKRGRAYQTLAREKADGWARFHAAQERGWTLEGEAAELLKQAVQIETDEDTFSENYLLKTLHRAQAYDLGALYQAWLVETWSTHATLHSAEAYFDVDPETRQGRLYRAVQSPPHDHYVPGGVTIAVFTTLTCYAMIDASGFQEQLPERQAELTEIMSRVSRA
jgi:hypothetical protein